MGTHGAKAYRPWTPALYSREAHAPTVKLRDDELISFLIDASSPSRVSLGSMPLTKTRPVAGAPFDPTMMV
jgi:hypothetical protein